MEGESEETDTHCNSDDEVEVVSSSHFSNLSSSLLMLKCDGLLCDVTIISGDFEIRAHRAVLASATEYFKAMFVNETKEAETGIVDFSRMEPEIVKQCIEFIYSGRATMSKVTVKDLIDASEMMQLTELCQLCVGYLAERIDMSNCAEVITLSHLYGKDTLNAPVETFLSKHFENFAKTADFIALDFNSVAHCMTLLQDGSSEREVQIWNGILSWTQHDEDRTSDFPKLFELIDLASLPKNFLEKEMFSHALVNDSIECLRRVAKFNMKGHALGKGKEIQRYFCYDADSQMIVQYESRSRKWSSVPTFPSELTHDIDLVTYKDTLYAGDGVRMYWLHDGDWRKTEIPIPKNSTHVTKSGYCCYGHITRFTFKVPADPAVLYCRCIGVRNAVYMVTCDYICQLDLATTNIVRYNATVGMEDGFFITASDEKIYIMGNGKTVEFGLKTKACGHLTDMLNCWSRGLAVWHNNKIFAFCSNSESDPCTVESYDTGTDQWVAMSNLSIPKQPRNLHVGEKLYLIGENSDDGPTYQAIDLQKLETPVTSVTKRLCVPATF